MNIFDELVRRWATEPGIRVQRDALLRDHTRFGIGGAAALLVDVFDETALVNVAGTLRSESVPMIVIGAGTNLIVADAGFEGAVVRHRASSLRRVDGIVQAEAGAELQALVDYTIGSGLAGMHTMTRIPGWVGAAVYGNAGAYGHSIHEFVRRVFYLHDAAVRSVDRAGCRFAYRESVFKRRKEWIILAVDLELPPGDPAVLSREAAGIQAIRDAKYPPAMKCAGSIFKNLLFNELDPMVAAVVPEPVIREGKVPSAWFLEQTGAKGMRRGDIQVATHHANLVYNDGEGTASDLLALIRELKARVDAKFGLVLEEEVQYVGPVSE
jgi:UDP-N-acetylmuramate dehydrogenase